jgi:hypothetical protein
VSPTIGGKARDRKGVVEGGSRAGCGEKIS